MPKENFLQNLQDSISPHSQNRCFRFSSRYKIIKDLGEGGIGRVYQAYDLWNKRECALKILTTLKENPLLWESFKNEFLLLTQLRHPGVVEVFDFGYAKPPRNTEQLEHLHSLIPYFTMEFVEGKSLHESLNLSTSENAWHFDDPIPKNKILYHFIWQICDILEYLHLRGMVHCDLKPDNLKVTDRIFNLKLLDFGLSETVGTKRKKTTKGTLPYMAPEMFLDEPLDERTDLYSLGVVLYELVTSKLPFFSDDPVKIVSGHLEGVPVPPQELNPHLDESLNQLILKLLEKAPSQRPQSALEIKEFATLHLKRNSEIAERKTFLTHLYSGDLVAREEEKAQVGQLLKETLSSGGKVVFLAGEQGAGKSFFLRDIKIKSQLEGLLYVDSNCLEDQTKAYQPLIEILRKIKPFLEDYDPQLREKFDQALSSILPKPQERDVSFARELFSVHQKIIKSLVEISQTVPLILAIDNLQWADYQSLRFLSDFGQNIEKSKIFLACAFRPEEIKEESHLKQLVERWRGEEWCKYIKFGRFDCQKTGIFIRSKLKRERLPEGFFSYLHNNTSGNPFFLTEVLKYLLEKEIVFLKDGGWEVDTEKLEKTFVPASIEAVLLKNIERYEKKVFDFLKGVAVIGKKFDLELVRKLNLLAEKDLSETLFILVKDQVFIKRESPLKGRVCYEFANQSLQSLLYQKSYEEKKANLHGTIAQLLEERGLEEDEETVFEIAHHYLKSQDYERAYQYALLSAEKMAQRFANQEVLEYLSTAIETASEFKDKEESVRKKVEALMKRADFCKRVGELNQAESDYRTILKFIQGFSDLKMLAKTYNDLGETYRLKHDYKKGILCLKKAMKIHQKLDDPLELALTLSYMGLLYWIDSQYQNALNSFQKALNIEKSLGRKSYIASSLNNIGLVHWSLHQYSLALKYFQDSLSIYRELDNKEWIARCLNNIGSALFESGEYLKCIDYYLESLKLNEEIKNKKEMTLNLANLGEAYRKIGDYPSALEYGQKGLQLGLEIDLTERVGHVLKDLGVTHFELGRYQEALGYFQRAKEIAEKIGEKELQVLVLTALSKFFAVLNDEKNSTRLLEEATGIINTINDERSLISVYQVKSCLKREEGQWEEALMLLDDALALAKKLNVAEEVYSLTLKHAELYLEREEIEKSREFLNRAQNSGLAYYILLQPEFYIISGRAESISGNLGSSKENFEMALKLAEKLRNPELIWRIHHHLGRVFLSLHHVERAYQELQKAGKILKEVSDNIKDEELKQNYLKDREKKELLSDLKEVAKNLIGETQII